MQHHCYDVKLGYKLGTVPVKRNSATVIVTVADIEHLVVLLP